MPSTSGRTRSPRAGLRILGIMAATIAQSTLEGRAVASSAVHSTAPSTKLVPVAARARAAHQQRSHRLGRPRAERPPRSRPAASPQRPRPPTKWSALAWPPFAADATVATQKGLEALFQEVSSHGTNGRELRAALARRLKRGAEIPGFGHVLYPKGDPRCTLILQLLERALPDDRRCHGILALIEQASELLGERPTLDVGLAAISHTFGLPTGSALSMFALGRSVGWLAHAIEQYEVSKTHPAQSTLHRTATGAIFRRIDSPSSTKESTDD